jgi:hypothetical protein
MESSPYRADKRVHFIYLPYKPGPGPVKSLVRIIFYDVMLGFVVFLF